jgi:hypothetical protein
LLADNKMMEKVIDTRVQPNKIIIVANNQAQIQEIMSRYKDITAIEQL